MRFKYRTVVYSFFGLTLAGALFIAGLILYAKISVENASDGRLVYELEQVPERKVALLLGCARYVAGGRPNLYFKYRMEAVQELYRSGKVKYVLVSGDNSRSTYDESTDMKDYLVASGIPAERVVCDFAGFSTLDSVLRAKSVFLEDSLIVVSQAFHVRRAIYIAEQHGIDLIAYPSRDVAGTGGMRTHLREHLARVKAVLDVRLLGSRPTYLGDPVLIGVDQP